MICPVAFRTARQRLGISQGRVAQVIGTNKMAISRFERGKGGPGPEKITKAARWMACCLSRRVGA